MSLPNELALPDFVSMCPFPWSTSPHYESAGADSAAWLDSYKVFRGRKQEAFKLIKAELLVSHVNCYAGFEEFRSCCDFNSLLYVLDEVSDEQDADGAHKTGDVFLMALDGRPCDDSALSRMTTEFRERFVKTATKNVQQRFLMHCRNYIDAVVREADLRSKGQILDEHAYMTERRENSGLQVCFALFEYIYGIDLPSHVFDDPIFKRMYYAGVDTVFLSNDIYSFGVEHSKGLAGNNILTVLMRSKDMTLQQATDHVGVWFKSLIDQFVADKSSIRSFGRDVDIDVQKYISAIQHWIIGHLIWSFQSQRYFGPEYAETQKTLLMKIGKPESVNE